MSFFSGKRVRHLAPLSRLVSAGAFVAAVPAFLFAAMTFYLRPQPAGCLDGPCGFPYGEEPVWAMPTASTLFFVAFAFLVAAVVVLNRCHGESWSLWGVWSACTVVASLAAACASGAVAAVVVDALMG